MLNVKIVLSWATCSYLSAFDVTDTKAHEIVDDATGDAQLLILWKVN